MRLKMMLAAAVLASTLAASSAGAAITIYTSQANFLAALSAYGTDTYNDLAGSELSASLNRSAGAFIYKVQDVSPDPDPALYVAGTAADRYLSSVTTADIIQYSNFSSGVSAIGGNFFTSGANGKYKASTLTVRLGAIDADDAKAYSLTNSTTSSFVGFISTNAITSFGVQVMASQSTALYPTVNNLILGSTPVAAAVPEPATWALMLTGFGLAGGALRRRRPQAVAA